MLPWSVNVLTTKFPGPPFMAYLRTIVCASRNFEGTAWASYDVAYRCQAANRGSLNWSEIDSALYNEAFTGSVKLPPQCTYCLAETHEGKDCQFAPLDDTLAPLTKKPRTSQPTLATESGGLGSVEICGLFNRPTGNQCCFKWCRYAHICAQCKKGPHPAAECTRFAGGPSLARPQAPPPRQSSGSFAQKL